MCVVLYGLDMCTRGSSWGETRHVGGQMCLIPAFLNNELSKKTASKCLSASPRQKRADRRMCLLGRDKKLTLT